MTSAGATASALLRSLSRRRRRRSSASATMTSSSSSSPSSSSTLACRELEIGDDGRQPQRRPSYTSVSSATSIFTSSSGYRSLEESRMMSGDGDWQRVKQPAVYTGRYVHGTTMSPLQSDVEQRPFARSCSIAEPSSSVASLLRIPDEQSLLHVTGALQPTPRPEPPPASMTSLPLYVGSRDAPEVTSRACRRTQSAASVPVCGESGAQRQLPAALRRYHQNGESSRSMSVLDWTSACEQRGARWADERGQVVACHSDEPAATITSTTTVTSTAADVWRPY